MKLSLISDIFNTPVADARRKVEIRNMKDYAKVVIEKKGLSSLQESINIGKQVMEQKLAAYKKKIEKFEQARGMDTKTFTMLFNKGELGDNKEWIEWDHVANVANLLNRKIHDLENLKYEY
ncbi:MAG: hypothetical protein KKD12_02845 [Proteobacteria bacterium]|nr:hypothetical protein [Pseudomonadota bacterium]